MNTEQMLAIVKDSIELSSLRWEQEILDWENGHPEYEYLSGIRPITDGRFQSRFISFGEGDDPESYLKTKGKITIPDMDNPVGYALEVELQNGRAGLILVEIQSDEWVPVKWIGTSNISLLTKRWVSYCMYEA